MTHETKPGEYITAALRATNEELREQITRLTAENEDLKKYLASSVDFDIHRQRIEELKDHHAQALSYTLTPLIVERDKLRAENERLTAERDELRKNASMLPVIEQDLKMIEMNTILSQENERLTAENEKLHLQMVSGMPYYYQQWKELRAALVEAREALVDALDCVPRPSRIEGEILKGLTKIDEVLK